MRALVTGGAGFIGSHLVNKLLGNGFDVIVIDNETSGSNQQPVWNDGSSNYRFDICDYEKTRRLYDDVDYVFHVAAQTRIQKGLKNPLETIRVNEFGTATVLQCSKESGVKKVVYSSTSSVYGNNSVPHNEAQQVNPLNPYSMSKLNGENLCKLYTNIYGLDTTILRYFNVYGYGQPDDGEYALVLGIFEKQKNLGIPLSIYGDGHQKRDFTHISDVISANLLSLNTKTPGEIFNIGSGKNYSISDIANFFSQQHIHYPQRDGESRETLADNSKAQKFLEWTPLVNLEEWIKSKN